MNEDDVNLMTNLNYQLTNDISTNLTLRKQLNGGFDFGTSLQFNLNASNVISFALSESYKEDYSLNQRLFSINYRIHGL